MYYEKRPSKKAKKGYTWCVKFYYIDQAGFKRRYSKSGFETKAAAQAHGIQKQKELQEYAQLPEDKTVARLWEEWKKTLVFELAPGTMSNYEQIYRVHLSKRFGNRKINTITYSELQEYFDGLDLSLGYVKNIKAVLSHLFLYAMKDGSMTHNPMNDVTVHAKKKSASEGTLSLSDLEAICEAIDNNNNSRMSLQRKAMLKIFLYIGYYTGLRIGEILALQKSDIDFDSRILHVWKKVEDFNGHPKLTTEMKTMSSQADLPLCQPLYEILRDNCKDLNDSDLLITNSKGELAPQSNFRSALKREAARAGYPDFHPHQLRHTFVTNLIRSGLDPKTAAQLARHKTVSITLNVYTQMNSDDLSNAIVRAFP